MSPEEKTNAQYKKGDLVWMAFDQSSSGRSGMGDWAWKQVKVVSYDADASEYKVNSPNGKEVLTVPQMELEGWQNLKEMLNKH